MQTQQIRNSVLEWLGRNANKVNGHPTPCFHQWVDALQLNPFDDPYNTLGNEPFESHSQNKNITTRLCA
jgi:hypothetical protein